VWVYGCGCGWVKVGWEKECVYVVTGVGVGVCVSVGQCVWCVWGEVGGWLEE